MKNLFVLPLLAILFASISVAAQDKSMMEFNNVAAKDFSTEKFSFDTSHGAVIIADVGKSSFVTNSKGYFSIVR